MLGKKTQSLTNGTSIAYLERPGTGAPLLLLHGITENARTYEPSFPEIDPACHLYALDLRGHGDSSKPKEPYGTQAYADDARLFIKDVIGKPALVAGHSLGGLVTVEVAATAPDLATRIFLEDPPLYFVDQLNDIYRVAFESMVLIATTLQNGSTPRETWFDVMAKAPDPYSGKPGIESVGEVKINQRLDSLAMMDPRALQDGLDGTLSWSADAVLENITCPVTLLTGNAAIGSVMTADDAVRAVSLLETCHHLHFDDVGHMIHDQKTSQWLIALNAFCKDTVSTL